MKSLLSGTGIRFEFRSYMHSEFFERTNMRFVGRLKRKSKNDTISYIPLDSEDAKVK